MVGEKGFTLVELVMILVILAILSVVAVPRYIGIQREAQEADVLEYICALNSTLAAHIADHYNRGAEWVKNGEELMGLLGHGPGMPRGMTYENNIWTAHGAGRAWRFEPAVGGSAPRIVQVN